ncbi:acetyltransferase [Enterobacteriaceae bacterium ESL0689]|nr:acetyltransferase [Enterobacteriaceae bacterium ESL0689]
MITLKYLTPHVASNNAHLNSNVFTLLPQGEPVISAITKANLQRLGKHIKQHLIVPLTVTCHPHRVGLHSCVAVTVTGRICQQVNILITVNGRGSWPTEEEYDHPRWYITVADAADLVYLVLWLNSLIVH